MKQTRRAFVTAVASIVVGTGVSSAGSSTDVQSVDIFMDSRLQGTAGRVNEMILRAGAVYEGRIDNRELSIGPAGVVEVPEHVGSDRKSAHSWWKSADERPSDRLSLLIVDGRSSEWNHEGYASVGGPSGVVAVSSSVPVRFDAMLVAHEVSHLLGLHHRHGERIDETTVTVESDLSDSDDEWAPTLSDRSVRKLSR